MSYRTLGVLWSRFRLYFVFSMGMLLLMVQKACKKWSRKGLPNLSAEEMLHGTGIFTYIWLKFMVIARKYSSPMKHLGLVFFTASKTNPVLVSFTKTSPFVRFFFGSPGVPGSQLPAGYLEFGLPPRGAPLRRLWHAADLSFLKNGRSSNDFGWGEKSLNHLGSDRHIESCLFSSPTLEFLFSCGLVVATQIFYCICSPWSLGFHDPIWRAYFSDGVKPPTIFLALGLFVSLQNSGVISPLLITWLS